MSLCMVFLYVCVLLCTWFVVVCLVHLPTWKPERLVSLDVPCLTLPIEQLPAALLLPSQPAV